jgi:hypothetical protein
MLVCYPLLHCAAVIRAADANAARSWLALGKTKAMNLARYSVAAKPWPKRGGYDGIGFIARVHVLELGGFLLRPNRWREVLLVRRAIDICFRRRV